MFPRYARALLVAVLVLPFLACRSNGGTRPDPDDPTGTTPAGAENGESAAAPEDDGRTRVKLYYDLDQYTKQWMAARAEGNSVTWTSLHHSVLGPMVDDNLDDILETVGKAEAGRLRIVAARALGFGSDPEKITPALIGALSGSDADMLTSALVSLYVLGNPDTPLGPLVALLNHPDQDVRANDTLALYAVLRARRNAGRVPLTDEVKSASGRLLALVSSPKEDPFVRGNAAAALGEIGDPMAVDVLLNLLSDPSSVVRTRAAEGLGQLGQEQAIPPLIDALGRSPAANESRVVVAALEKIAMQQGLKVDPKALGTDPSNWRAWYMAVRRP